MECEDRNLKKEVDKRVSEVFTRILQEIPESEFQEKNGVLISYNDFLDRLSNTLIQCSQKPSESPKNTGKGSLLIVMGITIFQIAKNHIFLNKQKKFMGKYFGESSNYNIKNKISELKLQIDNLLSEKDMNMEDVKDVLDNFEMRMRKDFLSDLKELLKKENR